jgi:putative FmdB family regulatory protein
MPFYDLRCNACDKEYNILASMKEKSEKRVPCPDCGSLELVTVYKAAPAYIKSSKAPQCQNREACGARCPHSQ